MIIQTLTEFHREQVVRGNPHFAPLGMSLKRIHFVLVLREDGVLVDVEQPEEKVFVAKSRERGGKEALSMPNRLWDSLGYVTGYGATDKSQQMAAVQHAGFVAEVHQIRASCPENRAFRAVSLFYARHAEQLHSHPLWETIASEPGHNLSFRLQGEPSLAAQQKEVVGYCTPQKYGTCIVSGQKQAIIHVHPKVNMYGGSPTGAKLVSFTKCSGYDSYHKNGCENAPMSVAAAEGYTSALTGLLQKDSGYTVGVGTVTFVFFTLPHSDFHRVFYDLLGLSSAESKQAATEALKHNLSSYADVEFVLMAFVPNTSRISVRLFVRIPVWQLVDNLLDFYGQTTLQRGSDTNDALSILTPLFAIAPMENTTKLPSQLIIDYMEAVVRGRCFPALMQQMLIQRLRERSQRSITLYSILRGYINRNTKINIPMALDQTTQNKGYLLGRMLAIMERAQELSNPDVGFTIRDIYYGTISITPSAVFNRLISLSGAFFRRIPSPGATIYLKVQFGEVIQMLDTTGIPTRLSLDEQNCFALGYFHQRQIYFQKRENNEQSDTEQV